MSEIIALIPPEGLKILVTLFLCFLIGLEREEHKSGETYTFGGVRTFPLIGLLGYALSLAAGGQALPPAVGFVVVGGFLLMSFRHKLETLPSPGVTTEVSALMTYVLGVLVQRDFYWIAATLVVLSLLLLELKVALEGMSRRLGADEIFSITQFLLLAAVILPAVPNQDYTAFHLNPFRTWLVVVAVSGVSYASYALQRLVKGRGGVVTAALLGGAYSSTVTTVTLAKKSQGADRPHLFAGAILMASGVMYLRLTMLLALFNGELLAALAPWFVGLAIAALLAGWLWSRRDDAVKRTAADDAPQKNPLELDSAFLFAGLFLAILIATHLAATYLGRKGVFGLAGIMGLVDVDPFIMGMTQTSSASMPVTVAAAAIAIAAASNNVAKGGYAYAFGDRRAGPAALGLLVALAALGLLPLLVL